MEREVIIKKTRHGSTLIITRSGPYTTGSVYLSPYEATQVLAALAEKDPIA